MSQPTTRTVGYVSPRYMFADGALAIALPHAPATLAEMARQGTHFQVRSPRAGLARPTSEAEHRALAVAAEAGRVLRGGRAGQAPVRTLVSLSRRGLLTLDAAPGSRRSNWSHGVLTEAGRWELARLDAEQERRRDFETARDRALSFTTAATAA